MPESKFAPLPGCTRGDINRAGIVLRNWWRSDDPIGEEMTNALELLALFREAFQGPLKQDRERPAIDGE